MARACTVSFSETGQGEIRRVRLLALLKNVQSDQQLSRATLDGWVLKVGELLIPMASTMRQELLRGTHIQADETPVDVQMHEGRGKNIKPISGSTAGREQRWCSTSVWEEDEMLRQCVRRSC